MKLIESKWLLRDDSLPWNVNGVAVAPETKTRREEYWWAQYWARPGDICLDAATGYIDSWHMLPKILVRAGWDTVVVAVDGNPNTLQMPAVAGVIRMVSDIRSLPFADNTFDTTFCISTLEHLEVHEGQQAVSELIRVTKLGGRIVATADYGTLLPNFFGFPSGSADVPMPALDPPVYACVVEK